MISENKLTNIKIKKKKLSFFRDVQSELKKVTWTSKNELLVFTKIVLAATLLFGFIIYLADLMIRNALSLITLIFQWMT